MEEEEEGRRRRWVSWVSWEKEEMGGGTYGEGREGDERLEDVWDEVGPGGEEGGERDWVVRLEGKKKEDEESGDASVSSASFAVLLHALLPPYPPSTKRSVPTRVSKFSRHSHQVSRSKLHAQSP